jgi:hypothetical protein
MFGNFVITLIYYNYGKKITPAVTLGIVVVNKGNNKITNHRAIKKNVASDNSQ